MMDRDDAILELLKDIRRVLNEYLDEDSAYPDNYGYDPDTESYEEWWARFSGTPMEIQESTYPYVEMMRMGCQCDKCPLNMAAGNDCAGPVLDDGGDYTILAVGEAPGEEEDREGRPFVGKSGQKLRDALEGLGYPMDKVTFTNVVKCRPPDNKLKAAPIKCCYTGVPIKENTKLVLLLGGTPLKAVIGERGITQWNGVVVDRDGIVYAPVYHPAYLLYNQSDEVLDAWLEALDQALYTYQEGMEKPADADIEYTYPVSLDEIQSMVDDLEAAPIISFDTEVAGLDPFDPENRMLAMSFSDGKKAWAVLVDHPMTEFPDDECIDDLSLDLILAALEQHPCVIGHNIKFDQMMVDHMMGCKFDAGGDTMLTSFLVESKQGIHGLKRLAGYYLGMFEYDKELADYIVDHPRCDYDRGGSYAHIPPDVLLPYAARDAAATWLLYPILMEKLTTKQKFLLNELTIPASNTLYRMQLNGIAIDSDVADRYRRLYGCVSQELAEAIQSDRKVAKYVDQRYAQYKADHPRGMQPRENFAFNPGSSQQKAAILFDPRPDGYGLKPLGFTDTGKPSTKRDYLEPYRAKLPLVDYMITYNMLGKMLSTYILPIATGSKLNADGRARSSFNQHVVVTGRLSSSAISSTLGFNQQNIPTPEKEAGTILQYSPIKDMFTHTWEGGHIMSVDYSGMELRVFASLAKCQAMIDIHASGKDFHTMVASMVSGLPEDQITKPMRYRYKWTNWTILFRGNEYTLYRLYGIDLEEGKETIALYFEMFPEVPEFQEECIDFARDHGYIETPFGNRRPLPDIHAPEDGRRSHAERAAANTPVQGAAGLVTVQALTIIDYLMGCLEFKSMLVNTVHDSIMSDVYPGEEGRLAALQVDVMENIVEYSSWFMPNLDMDWLICPLKADIEIGTHYGSVEHAIISDKDMEWAQGVRKHAIGGKYG